MNKQAQVLRLESGQALPLPRRAGGTVVLSRGELLMQEPARWLAGTVVLPPPVRLVAPASLPAGAACSFVAVRDSTVVVEEAGSRFPTGFLRALVSWIGGAGRRGQGAPGGLAG